MATRKAAKAKKAARVRVRMYRQGLGDCFLITVPGKAGKPFHMLIDCGVVLGTTDPAVKMAAVVEDVLEVTGNKLDVLVATHEHWDHISGFVQVPELFEKLEVKDVWLAWTEDPADPLAKKLREERRAAEKALRMAAQHLAVRGAKRMSENVDSLMGFFGAKAGSTEDALNNVKKMAAGRKKPRYCKPGEPPIALEAAPAVRFWIMGPPRDEKLIKKSNPGKGDAYGLDAGPGGRQAFFMSALSRNMGVTGAGGEDAIEEPFDEGYTIPMARAEQLPFFARRYFGEAGDEGVFERKSGVAVRDQSWRRIDSTWLDSSETMALQLDSATNNTSLVIAIEIVATGEVLLFPGDAQAGNWLSWQALEWKLEEGKKRVTGPELLARTVLYKVGHHGSHNATLKAKGLELMTSEDLVAMIPVDHEMAVKKHWGKMPLPDLVDRIKEKTQGRVLRVDDAAVKPADLGPEWKTFGGEVAVTPLYYELSF